MRSFVFAAFVFLVTSAAHSQQVPANCQFQVNPHSYGCMIWTFQGNQMFPLLPINLDSLRGQWRAITFADPSFENDGPEFAMFVDEQRPTIPMGVLDKATGGDLGNVSIGRLGATQMSWRGQRLESNTGSMHMMDTWTFQWTFIESQFNHSFTCRVFNRNNTEHLLCSWDIMLPGTGRWAHKALIGYLRVGAGE